MKNLFVAVVLFLFPLTAQAQSFKLLTPKVELGGVLVAQIAPQWRAPGLPGSSLSFMGENYLPGPDGHVFIGIDVHTVAQKYGLTLVEYSRGVRLSSDYAEVEVVNYSFPKTRTASFTGQASGLKNINERNGIDRAFGLENRLKEDMTHGAEFILPLDCRNIIDPFGLIYGNNPTLPHWGIDIGVPVGTPVKSVNKGQVVLVAKKYRREGNMVIINHGQGVFSVYMHLSKITVREGQLVERGQVFGLSGRSGKGVREPHLHFNIRIQKIYVDPLRFIDIVNGLR